MTRPPHEQGDEPDLNALAAFVDGRLEAADRAAIIAHLAECGQCRNIVAGLSSHAARTMAAPRRMTAILSLAATLAIALAGGGLYWMTRESRTPGPGAPQAAPSQAPAPPESQPPAPPATVAPPETAEPPLQPPVRRSRGASPDRTRAAGTRTIDGRTFRLVAGEWIDVDYHPTTILPVVDIKSRDDLNARPALRSFISLGSRFTVIVDGTVYHVAVPASER